MNHLLDHHRAVADPFNRGQDAVHLGLMMHMTRGMQFPWVNGGIALMRCELYPDVHAWEYCGLAFGADTQIRNYPGYAHSPGQAYIYTAVTILGNGMISVAVEPVRLAAASRRRVEQPRRLPPFVPTAGIAAGSYFTVEVLKVRSINEFNQTIDAEEPHDSSDPTDWLMACGAAMRMVRTGAFDPDAS